jgi:acyl carrier protein phosphodiesterase
MNYLAHAYLSFNNDEILVGNMISDFIKGKKKFDYPATIQKGITLHRAIDEFTDTHAVTKDIKQLLKPAVGLYAAAFADVIYDHFLATDNNEFFSEEILLQFTQVTYSLLEPHQPIFPEKFKTMFSHMQSQNWLYNYQFNWGIEKSFGGVTRRAKYLDDSIQAFHLFEKEYHHLKNCYRVFFPEVKFFARNKLAELLAVE